MSCGDFKLLARALYDRNAALWGAKQMHYATVEGMAKLKAVFAKENGTVTGVREALETLKQRKGYLFAPPARGAWAQRVSAGGVQPLTGVEEAFYRKNPGLRK